MLYIDQHDENGVSVVALRGEAGVAEAQSLAELMIPLAAARPAKLIFDLSQLRFISSLALGEMASLAGALRKFKSRLAIAGSSPQIKSGLRRMRLDCVYETFESVGAAVAELGGQAAPARADGEALTARSI